MPLPGKYQQTISDYLRDSANPTAIRNLGSLYWTVMLDTVGQQIRDTGDFQQFLREQASFINFGVIEDVIEDAETVCEQIQSAGVGYPHLKIELVTDWLDASLARIKENDRRQLLTRDIQIAENQKKRCDKEIISLQQSRRALFMDEMASSADDATADLIDRLVTIDDMAMSVMKTRRSIAKGTFFSVQERRDLVARETKLRDETARSDGLLSRVNSEEKRAEIRSIAHQLQELFAKLLESEDHIVRMEKEIDNIQQKQQKISLVEVESRMLREIEYVRDLVMLCARRLKMSSCSVVRPKEPCFTLKELHQCLDHILQFDPKIFRNDRVNFFGKPSLLLIPGNGNALYDWKNNRFLVPLMPPAGGFMGSIATAIIEYRLDVDEEKNLVNSYSKLPHLKKVRSIIQIKNTLIKDYLTWMTGEARGYKLLPRETRMWFEHEIAPSKNEIYCPPDLQQFMLSADEFKTALQNIESRLAPKLEESPKEDLWRAAILNYQQGKFERAFECIKTFVGKDEKDAFGQYNLGVVAMKVSRKQEAAKAFNDFAALQPQSWWTNVVRDHLRRLAMA
jgi:hypothetical protein